MFIPRLLYARYCPGCCRGTRTNRVHELSALSTCNQRLGVKEDMGMKKVIKGCKRKKYKQYMLQKRLIYTCKFIWKERTKGSVNESRDILIITVDRILTGSLDGQQRHEMSAKQKGSL